MMSGCEAFFQAIENGDYQTVETMLLKQSVNINMPWREYSPLQHAVFYSQFDKTDEQKAIRAKLVTLLIDHGAQVNQQNKHGESSLHMAIAVANLELVKVLIEKGASSSIKNQFGHTPIQYAEVFRSRDANYQEYFKCMPAVLFVRRKDLPPANHLRTHAVVFDDTTDDNKVRNTM